MLDDLGKSVLLRSPNWLGDAIMTMPAVNQMLSRSDITFTVLAPTKLHDVWKLLPGIHEVIPASKNIFTTIKWLRGRKFDSTIIFPNSLRSALEVFFGGVPMRIGYQGHFRRWLLTTAFEKQESEFYEHQKLDYLRLVEKIGFEIASDPGLPVLRRPDEKPLEENYFVVCPGAEYGPAKRWPVERFAEAAKFLAEKHSFKVVLLGAKKDVEIAKEIESKLGELCKNFTGKTTLSHFISFIAHARLVLCNDSGAMHLAALLRTPGVAVFGSTEPNLTGLLYEEVRILRAPTECSPCFLKTCSIDYPCMNKISVENVTSIAEDLL
jgi:heptosyltransferase-2